MKRLDHFLAAFGLSRIEQRSADHSLSPSGWNRALSAFAGVGGVESNLAVGNYCVWRQATGLAAQPFGLFERQPDGGKKQIREGSLARIIAAPNAGMSRFDLIEAIVRALHFTGNFYAEVKYGRDGLFESLTPLSNSAVTVETTTSGAVRLRVSEPGGTRVLVAGEYLHVRMPGHAATDLVGVSTVQRARGALGLALDLNDAAKESAAKNIGGYLIQQGDTDERNKRARRDGLQDQTDRSRADKFTPRILDPGAKFIPTTFSSADAQLLESRKLSAQDVALSFGMSPSMCGLLDTSSYGSAAQAAEDFVVGCLAPLAARIESAFETCLLSEEMQQTHFVEFNLNGLLRANPSDRFRQYEIGRRIGLYNPNDLRRLENLPPRTDAGGDEYEGSTAAAPKSEPSEPPIASTNP